MLPIYLTCCVYLQGILFSSMTNNIHTGHLKKIQILTLMKKCESQNRSQIAMSFNGVQLETCLKFFKTTTTHVTYLEYIINCIAMS